MGAWKELDMIIADYVGYKDDDYNNGPADTDLYDRITKEITEHVNGRRKRVTFSKDAKQCFDEWEKAMMTPTVNKEM